MKKTLRRGAAVLLAVCMLSTAALALTPDQLGRLLRDNYLEEIPGEVWRQTTVQGMLDALGDEYAQWLTAAEVSALGQALDGTGGTTFQLEGGHVGVLTLTQFNAGTAALAERAVAGNDAAADRWIVDLRDNSGDALSAAAQTAGVFVGAGELAYLRDKAGTVTAVKSDRDAATADPVILLVNGGTRGAAELFAGIVRDSRAGLVVGSRTAGKGTAQSLFSREEAPDSFPTGEGLLLTTHRFFSSGFNSNNILGVIPYIAVSDELAPKVARLLCGAPAGGATAGHLQLRMGGWRWYVDLAAADSAALTALLEALPPQAELYLGTGKDWAAVTPANAAARYGKDYAPRAFPDVAGSDYADAINALKTYGILKGDEKGNFNPKGTLDRATLCALLAQAMNYPASTEAPAFADTPADKWYTPYVTTLSAMGIVNGYDDGLFHPNDPIPHQQFMTILSRIVAYTNHMANASFQLGPTSVELERGDYALYDKWAVPGAWLLDGQWHAPAWAIDPKGPTLREEAAYDLWAALSTLDILPG